MTHGRVRKISHNVNSPDTDTPLNLAEKLRESLNRKFTKYNLYYFQRKCAMVPNPNFLSPK